MHEDEQAIDWTMTTFEGSRLEQLRRTRTLTVRQRLEAMDALAVLNERLRRSVHVADRLPVTTVQYVLVGKPLPRVEDSLRIGELLRVAVISQARREFGGDNVPAIFSGHGLPSGHQHGHAFYLPWDADGDGRIDRLVLHVPLGMDARQRCVIEAVRQLWSGNGGEWQLLLEGIGPGITSTLLSTSTEWQSATPYLHPWYRKKREGIEDQIRRECRDRSLPEPLRLERCETIVVGQQTRRPIHFHRFRSRRVLRQPDRLGSFWHLTFVEPIAGPLALGFGCHFGLGLFVPVQR